MCAKLFPLCNTSFRIIRKVLKRKLPSKDHRKAWLAYEHALSIRSNLFMTTRLVTKVVKLCIGMMAYHQS